MAMDCIFLTQDSPGAPVLSGTNGALCAVLDWALAQKGWAIEYSAANARVYRAASGNRMRLSVRHDSAVSGNAGLATVRGCESATSAVDLVDPFPTVAQLANANATWVCSEAASSAARQYRLTVAATWFVLRVRHGTSEHWETQVFGDMPKARSEDAWNTVCTARGSGGVIFNLGIMMSGTVSAPAINNCIYWVRSIDGSIKSTKGMMVAAGAGNPPGSLPSFAPARSGYGNRMERERLTLGCSGGATVVSAALYIYRRGWVPNTWLPLHSGPNGMTSGDTHTDSAYAAGSVFRTIPTYTMGFHLAEETDTWSPPSG